MSDKGQRERWIEGIMRDYPRLDRLMAESVVDTYMNDPQYFNDVLEGKCEAEPIARPTEYVVKDAVSVEDA